MVNLKISATIIEEIALKELDKRIEFYPDQIAMDVYRRISAATSTRKDGSINIDVSPEELQELAQEARFAGDSLEADGSWQAWAALGRQIRKVR